MSTDDAGGGLLLSRVWRGRRAAASTDRSLAQYLDAYRRHTAGFLGLLLVGAAAGVTVGLLTPAEYASTATVLVTPTGVTDPNPGRNRAPAAVDLDTEIQLAGSPAVVSAASSAVSITPSALRRHLALSVPANSRVLRFRFTAATGTEAARGANAVADAYLAQRLGTAENVLSGRITRLSDQVKQVQSDLESATGRLKDPAADAGDQLYADSEVQVLTRQLTSVSQRLQQARLTVVTPGQEIIDATAPRAGSGPGPARRGLEGLMLGLLTACAATTLLGLRRRRVHGLADLKSLVPAAVLTTGSDPHPLGHRPADLVAGLARRLPRGGLVAVLGVGGQPGLPTALATARAVRSSHYRPIVLAWPREQPAERGPEGAPGTAEFLLDPTLDPLALATQREGVPFLAPGLEVRRAATTISRRRLALALAVLQGQVDYTFVPVDGTRPHSAAVVQAADAVLLVARDQVTEAGAVRQLITQVGAHRVVGVQLLPAPGRAGSIRRRRPRNAMTTVAVVGG